VFIDVSLL